MSVGTGWGARPVEPLGPASPAAAGRAVPPPRVGVLAWWQRGLARLEGFGRAAGLVWLAGALVALAVALPLYPPLDEALSHSRYAAAAARGFDVDWFMDVQSAAGGAIAAMNTPLLAGALVMLLLSLVFAGGVLGRLRAAAAGEAEPPLQAAAFLAAGAAHFGRFFRLFLLAALAYGLVFWFVRIRLSERLEDVLAVQGANALVLMARMAFALAVLALLAWIHMAQDLARLAAVVQGRRGMVLEFLRGLFLAARHYPVLSGLYLWALSGWLVLSAVYLAAAGLGARAPAGWQTLALIALSQLYMLGRTWLGFGLTASLLSWYEANVARA